MSGNRSSISIVLKFSLCFFSFFDCNADEAKTKQEAAPKVNSRAMEVNFIDGSLLRLVIVDEVVEISTPHGNLHVPTSDILRIQFAQRLSTDVQTKVDRAIKMLGEQQQLPAQKAAAVIVGLKEQAYLAVVRATKSENKKLADRAIDVLERIQEELGKESGLLRNTDVLETADCRIVGLLTSPQIKVMTRQFGELPMKLADVRSLRAQALVEQKPKEEPKQVLPNPGNLQSYASMIGKTFFFRVTGAGGSIYGTDVYTSDSALAAAAVHTGVLKAGETGVVEVKIVTPPASFTSTARNGVTSSSWGAYSGAFEIIKPGKKKKKFSDVNGFLRQPRPPLR